MVRFDIVQTRLVRGMLAAGLALAPTATGRVVAQRAASVLGQ